MNSKALFKIGYGLYLLSAKDGEKDNACIVNTFMQINSDPILLLGVNKQNHTCSMIQSSGRFNVSALTTDTPFSLFQRFGFQSGRDTDKFAGFSGMERAENGIYRLTQNSNAFFCCKVLETMDFGSHLLFKAAVEDMQVLDGGASLSYDYYHAHVKPRPQAAKKSGWRCEICGYIHEGEELPEDFVCPLCKHGASDFVKIEV